VPGWSAAPCTFRFPNEKISGRAPGRSRNGLSAGTRTVVVEPQDLAAMVVQALGLVTLAAVHQGHVEQPGAVEDQARAEVLGGARLGLKSEDHLEASCPPRSRPRSTSVPAPPSPGAE
jgi:hypothetical protein